MLTKSKALDFLYKAREFTAQNSISLYSWHPWRKNQYQSGIKESFFNVFNFSDTFDFKSIDDLIAEIENSQEFDSESYEAKVITRLMSKKEGYYLESFHANLRKIEAFFLDYLQDATGPDRLYTINIGGQEYRISPHSLFYISPFFNGNDHTDILERKNIIEQKLNEELEKRLSLDTFLEPFRKNQQRKEVAGLMMLHRDGFVTPTQSATQNQQRFFAMTKPLPQELYGVVTKAVVDSKKEILTDIEIVDGAEKMLLQF